MNKKELVAIVAGVMIGSGLGRFVGGMVADKRVEKFYEELETGERNLKLRKDKHGNLEGVTAICELHPCSPFAKTVWVPTGDLIPKRYVDKYDWDEYLVE